MSENAKHVLDEDEGDVIFVNGDFVDPDSIDSAIDALARDEVAHAEAAAARTRRMQMAN